MHIQITTPWSACISIMTLVASDLPATEFTLRAPQWWQRPQWTEVNPDAAWAARPGHQAVVLANDIYVFGGFGISADPANPFKPSNPMDVWVSRDGKEFWRKDFVKELKTPLPDFGFVCSPLIDGDAVYVQAAAGFVRLNKLSGEVVWRTLADKGGMWGSAFSSPIIVTLAAQRQLVVQTRDQIAGVNLADGKVLWSQPVEAFRGMNILTPVAHNDTLFTSTYGGKTIGFKVAQVDGAFKVTQSWTHKAQGYMSTPVVINGVAYEHLKSQRMMAIEVETGRELWTASEGFGKYASLVAQGDRILALDQRGLLYLLRANRKQFELLDKRRLNGAESWAHLAVAGDDLFVRELNALAAYRWTASGRQATQAGAVVMRYPP